MRVKWLVGLAVPALVALVANACGELHSSSGDPTSTSDAAVATTSDGSGPGTPPPSSGDACAPRTCGDVDASCGAILNGCGGEIPDCGTCSGAMYCNGNTCTSTPCTPLTPAQACVVGTCGKTPDGCGGFLNCPPNCGTDKYCSNDSCKPLCEGIAGGCGVIKLTLTCANNPADFKPGYRCSGTPSFASSCSSCGVGVDGKQYYCCN